MSIFGLSPSYSYTTLPDVFYRYQLPHSAPVPSLVVFNSQLALVLGIDCLNESAETLAAFFSGSNCSSHFSPIAQAYAGHQFGHLTMLGDGRALLLTEYVAPTFGRVDIQLKGSGKTPFSRNGDGKAALAPMLREYVISEAMAALGIPTTRSLAVVQTGEPVYRDRVLDGAVLTRVAKSHIRVGTFEFAALQEDPIHVKVLADYTISRHYPRCLESDTPYVSFLEAVIDAQARLVSQWMLVGFVHGVMNTDNVSIAGETIDYGPCAFMDVYDPNTVFSSIDRFGRYAYGNQPSIMNWNLARFAETLLPLLADDTATALDIANHHISGFSEIFSRYWLLGMKQKLGLYETHDGDDRLISDFLNILSQEKLDYTLSFLDLCVAESVLVSNLQLSNWHKRWLVRLENECRTLDVIFSDMKNINPQVVPRNYYVEQALKAAEAGDLSLFNALLTALQSPFDSASSSSFFRNSGVFDKPYVTFCGT